MSAVRLNMQGRPPFSYVPPDNRLRWCGNGSCAVKVPRGLSYCERHDGTHVVEHICGCGHRCYDRVPLGTRIECEHALLSDRVHRIALRQTAAS